MISYYSLTFVLYFIKEDDDIVTNTMTRLNVSFKLFIVIIVNSDKFSTQISEQEISQHETSLGWANLCQNRRPYFPLRTWEVSLTELVQFGT